MIPKIEIDQEIVKINVISVGGRKMTKSVFNQIVDRSPLNQSVNFIGDSIIGFVNDSKGRYLLFNANGELRKSDLAEVQKIASINESTRMSDFHKLGYYFRHSVEGLFEHDIQNDNEDRVKIAEHYPQEIIEKILRVSSKAREFLKVAYERQIFIAN